MRFVVDETSWVFNDLEPRECVEALEEMLDLIDDVQAHGHDCCYSEDLFHIPIRDGRSFYELYSPDSPIPIANDLRVRIAAAFNRLPFWQDLETQWPTGFEVTIASGVPEFAPSVAWACEQTSRITADAVACISHPLRRASGKVPVSVAAAAAPVWFVSTVRDVEHFFRWLIEETTESPEQMRRLSISAFRGLDFVEGSFNGIKNMTKPYNTLVVILVKHLAALSDEGLRIFSGPRERVSAEFGPLGVDISDENGETKANRRARAERTRMVAGEPRVFWWHTKLERHQDRIHFCPEKVTSGGRILIGIFCRHLTV